MKIDKSTLDNIVALQRSYKELHSVEGIGMCGIRETYVQLLADSFTSTFNKEDCTCEVLKTDYGAEYNKWSTEVDGVTFLCLDGLGAPKYW